MMVELIPIMGEKEERRNSSGGDDCCWFRCGRRNYGKSRWPEIHTLRTWQRLGPHVPRLVMQLQQTAESYLRTAAQEQRPSLCC